MRDQDLDRLIDHAARQLVGAEPSDALTGAVMATIRDTVPARRPGRLVWVVGSVAACVLLAVMLIPKQSGGPVVSPPDQSEFAPREQTAVDPPRPVEQGKPAEAPRVTRPQSVSAQRAISRSGSVEQASTDEGLMLEEPISIQPITQESIEIPPLERVSADPVDALEIEPIVIEVLSVAND